jgi:hypothetical protein
MRTEEELKNMPESDIIKYILTTHTIDDILYYIKISNP